MIIYCFTSRSRFIYWYGDVIITGEGLQNLGLCSALRAFEQRGIFIVPHLHAVTRGLGFSGLILMTYNIMNISLRQHSNDNQICINVKSIIKTRIQLWESIYKRVCYFHRLIVIFCLFMLFTFLRFLSQVSYRKIHIYDLYNKGAKIQKTPFKYLLWNWKNRGPVSQ
jgi:hypothetical protein